MNVIRRISVPGRWCIHSYYTLPPYAPDGSGRLLLSGVDLSTKRGKIYVIGADGSVEDEFGENSVESNFYHTGFWQTWSPDCRYVYFQSGSLTEPEITRRELATGHEITLSGDAEGAPPHGEPVVSGLLGMLYAAGYGYGVYNPAIAPVPFEDRTRHGVFEYTFDPAGEHLRLSVQQILDAHPDREKLLAEDRRLAKVYGTPTGLSLMCYCIRWNRDGSRMMIHFGNHCVARKEPKVLYIFTCKRDFSDLKLALNLENGGVHWSWHPDCEHLVGYARQPGEDQTYFCMVRYDGTGFRRVCDAFGGGHPSVSPHDYSLMVTDMPDGKIEFWDLDKNKITDCRFFPNMQASPFEKPHYGSLRNQTRVCHHPVFSQDGSRVLFNAFDGDLSELVEVETPGRI